MSERTRSELEAEAANLLNLRGKALRLAHEKLDSMTYADCLQRIGRGEHRYILLLENERDWIDIKLWFVQAMVSDQRRCVEIRIGLYGSLEFTEESLKYEAAMET